MKKIINDPEDVVDETIEGILKAYPHHLKRPPEGDRSLVRKQAPVEGKVAIATGGGSGHIPVFLGYVGEGLADGVAIGNVFSSPPAQEMVAVTKAIASGKGVLYLYGNYAGDVMNFDMAADMVEPEGIEVQTTVVTDDVASSPPEEKEDRRGIAGLFYAYKLAGAKAEEGAELGEVKRIADKTVGNTRSMGVALSPCTIPEAGEPTFEMDEDKMEIGMGIHGEQGIERIELQTADKIAENMTNRIIEDLPFEEGHEVSVLINGLGATPPEELYILYNEVAEILENQGINVYRAYVGEYATSMEMKGASVTLLKLDDELKELLNRPYHSPFILQSPVKET